MPSQIVSILPAFDSGFELGRTGATIARLVAVHLDQEAPVTYLAFW
jgi:hypothetical protein